MRTSTAPRLSRRSPPSPPVGAGPVAAPVTPAVAARFAAAVPAAGAGAAGRLFTLLLVALLQKRRRQVLRQHHQEEFPARRAGVGRGLAEAVLAHAGVLRAEEVQVLAGGVEDRLDRLAQPVGDGERLVLLQRVEVDLR